MSEQWPSAAGITEDLRRLMAVLPAVSELLPTDPVRVAWVAWKTNLLWQVQQLERRERELQSEPNLWIELSMAQLDAVGWNSNTENNTPSDLQ